MSETNKSYTITQYSQSVERLLKSKVPPIWVQGVISQMQVRGRVVYLTLAEYDKGSEKPLATLSLMCWKNDFESLQIKAHKAEVPFEIQKELKVSFLVEPDFYVPMGKFQPKVVDLDPRFIMGEMAMTRDHILKKLRSEGLIHKNKNLNPAKPCLKIGLITAPHSAAYADFTTALNDSEYHFEIVFQPATMQGERTAQTVVAAMAKFATEEIDILVLTRGGGSKTDLVYFDSESICRAIAAFHKPVISGIGHQIDESLTDQVSWSHRMTPTDCAKLLIKMADEEWNELLSLQNKLSNLVIARLRHSSSSLRDIQGHIRSRSEKLLLDSSHQLKAIQRAIIEKPKHRVQLEMARFHRNKTGLERGAHKLMTQNHMDLISRLTQLKSLAIYKLHLQQETIKLKSKLITALSPQRILERGYTLTRSQKGTPHSKWASGEDIITETKDQIFHSRLHLVTNKKMKK